MEEWNEERFEEIKRELFEQENKLWQSVMNGYIL